MSSANIRAQIEKAALARRDLCCRFMAVRLFDGVGDGLSGLFIDKYGETAIAHVHGTENIERYREALRDTVFLEPLGIRRIFLRAKMKESAKSALTDAELIVGTETGAFVIEEHGVRYLIDIQRQVNAGLFLDMREVRSRIKETCSGKRVLNLFCYTGSLGLSALCGGAAQVTQVDISKAMLRWAKENLELNSAAICGEMRLIPEDALAFFEKEQRRIARGADRYNTVIIDPPSFSRSEQGTFQIERDLAALARGALEVAVNENFEIYLTTNLTAYSPEKMIEQLRREIPALYSAAFDEIAPPKDFTSPLTQSIAMRGVRITGSQTSFK